MKPKIMQGASDALAVSNANPFPRRAWNPVLTDGQNRIFNDQKQHFVKLKKRRAASLVVLDDYLPPLPQPPQPKPKKPQSNSHLATILRWAAQLKRIFY